MKLLYVILILILAIWPLNAQEGKMEFNKLTPEEEDVILKKGTERPYTGKYNRFSEKGVYSCKRCDAPLYKSEDKFDAHCGWPSFDDEIPGAVKRVPDADGRRTEIICNNCGGHLGHVFLGEGFTDKNTRHCVNSISLNFKGETIIDKNAKTNKEIALFGGGCFWGVEHLFKTQKGVLATAVGYSGGDVESPTYEQVCSGNTGHIEVIEIQYDPQLTDYKTLAKYFFEIHDPTQENRQGPDIGEQYQSVIFYQNETQKEIGLTLIQLLKDRGYDVKTRLRAAERFWAAEDYHQNYYQKTGKAPYCHFYQKKF
jgi:peptide methionine sulfoxide reductase msrA/msrB